MQKFGISTRLTFSNSLLKENHLSDKKCNKLCKLFSTSKTKTGIVIYSDLLLEYLKNNYPQFYYISSTTKVLTEFSQLESELNNPDFDFVVPDFRLNKSLDKLNSLTQVQKSKVEFLCNECCWIECKCRKFCYENVSRKSLGENCQDYKCTAPKGDGGYRFSLAMENPAFIGVDAIKEIYLTSGFSNFKIEGRSLGSAMLLEFILYYMTKPEYQLKVREEIYLDSMLDLF